MSGRSRGPSHPINGVPYAGFPPIQEPRQGGPHPAILEELRSSQLNRDPRSFLLEERLAVQHQDVQQFLLDNQRLAATHVALKQELELAQYELKRMMEIAGSMQADKDVEFRQVYDKCLKLEADLRVVEGMRAEFVQVCDDIKRINASRKELADQAQALTDDLTKVKADLKKVPVLKEEIEMMKQELRRARAAIEYEKKGHADNYEQGQAMDRNLITMAREVEMLRAEISNAEKRGRAAAAVVSTGPGYGGNYSNPNTGYGGNPYPAGYGINHVQNGGSSTQYGPGPAAWGEYGTQHGGR